MAEGEEFVFDAVIGFLTSPIWNYPVRTFIEQNSLGIRNFQLYLHMFFWIVNVVTECKYFEGFNFDGTLYYFLIFISV